MSTSRSTLSTLLLPILLLLIAMASVQSGASIAKQMFPLIGAQGTTTLRLLFAAVIMSCLLRPWRVRMTASAWRSVVLYGLSLGGMNFLFYMSLRSIPLGVAVALEFTGPLTVALLASRKPRDFFWAGLAACGLLLLVPWRDTHAALDPVGAAYALGAGVCWALYIVFGQKAGEGNGVATAALGVIVAACLVTPFGIAHAGTDLLQPVLIPMAIGVAILSTALPYSLEMIALTRMPTKTFGILMSVEPAFGAVSGLLFLGEVLSLAQWLAILAIITASVGATLTARKDATPAIAAD